MFYSNDHEPIHVHGKCQGRENKAELIVENGVVIEVNYSNVRGKRPLSQSEMKNFQTLVEDRADDIVQKWINYFIHHKEISSENITRRIN